MNPQSGIIFVRVTRMSNAISTPWRHFNDLNRNASNLCHASNLYSFFILLLFFSLNMLWYRECFALFEHIVQWWCKITKLFWIIDMVSLLFLYLCACKGRLLTSKAWEELLWNRHWKNSRLGALSMRTSIMRKMSAENIIQFGTPELL